jgi:hypothetical protein
MPNLDKRALLCKQNHNITSIFIYLITLRGELEEAKTRVANHPSTATVGLVAQP